ncbi:MAG: 2,4-dihydroxyhept-2-ene-1,7-dioic acid aldolase [Candidatus Melainabacteria bacterium]|nr:MAG: 2,4-dihydroxyhept-2-ene-1,7-dioic acid aldolase [Candidatus Melainabacteria bacterium]
MRISFKKKLGLRQPLVGTLVSLAVPEVAEMLSLVGFDWLWIDMEHAPLSLDHVRSLLQATSEKCSTLVRIPVNDEVWIKRVLDLGPDGIIVPQVKSADEAERAVRAAKYPPEGTRSAGIARAHEYGISFNGYVERANTDVAVVIQIEHIDAVKNVQSILRVDGVDAVIIGPYDLSGSFGKLGQVQDKEVQDAIETVIRACQKAGIPCGAFALRPETAKDFLGRGFSLVAVGLDAHYLWSAAQKSIEAVKGEMKVSVQ